MFYYAPETQESILGDLNGKDVNTASELGEGQDRVEKVKALESLLAPTWGINAEHITLHYITFY